MTAYMVLGGDSSAFWTELDLFEARDAEHAVQQAAEANPSYSLFLAIPGRSFKTLAVTRETVTTTKVAVVPSTPTVAAP